MDFNRILGTLTVAGLVGLFVLEWRSTVGLINTASGASNSYMRAVQGRAR